MKLKAIIRVGGVKVLGRKPNKGKIKPGKGDEKVAYPGDVYDGPKEHVDLGYAEPYETEIIEVEDSDKAPTVTELKDKAKELGATEDQLKPLKSVEDLLELIDQLEVGL